MFASQLSMILSLIAFACGISILLKAKKYSELNGLHVVACQTAGYFISVVSFILFVLYLYMTIYNYAVVVKYRRVIVQHMQQVYQQAGHPTYQPMQHKKLPAVNHSHSQ